MCLFSVVHVVHIGRGLATSSMCGGCPCCLYLSISGGLVCVEALVSCPRFALFVPMIRPSCPRFGVFVPMRTAAVVVDCKRRRGGVPFGRSSFGAAARFSTRQSLYTSGRFFRVLSIFGGVYGIASTRPPPPCGLTLSGCSFGAVSVPKKNAACLFGFGWWLRRSPLGAYSPAACIASTRRGGLCPKTAKKRPKIG